jgi:hypothetical protein
MSQYYTPKRTRNIYDPGSDQPFKLSRSKIDMFLNCQRCFYLDRRLGVGQPPGYPFSLNSAVDTLLKREFDLHRAKNTKHPLMESYGIDAVPFQHEKMDEWRETFKGIGYYHEPSGFIVTGSIDDIWVNPEGEISIVDYKATSKNGQVNLDAAWQIGYKRQMEVYQWLYRMNGFKVSDTGYFVYCNGRKDKEAFDAKLEFDVTVIPYEGNPDWIEATLIEAKACLSGDQFPDPHPDCDFCAYRKAVRDVTEVL